MNNLSAIAQQTGKVKGQAVEGATISLLNASDSSLVKLAVAGASGMFELEQVYLGEYLLQVSAVGYQTYYTTAFALKTENENYDLKVVPLSKNSD
ncbi:carboxypeptidase-like regulatory domain-containing protein, partial [Flavihumibacter sediminis]|nr:carboxypeptidase-like regulatory domain-containing protein [Flavihumibacter sediminis]